MINFRKARRLNWVDPNATVQTGRGLPQWRGTSHWLSWSRGLAEERALKLWLLPPSWHRALRRTFALAAAAPHYRLSRIRALARDI